MAVNNDPIDPERGEETLSYAARPRPARGPIAQILHSTRRSFREAFSRESLVSSFKSILWVAPLTVLIWIYAEREQRSKLPDFPIPVEVKSTDPRVVIKILRPSTHTVEATLEGSRAKLDAVHDEFARGGDSAVARIEIDRNIGMGEQQIGAERLESDPIFARNGITLTNLQPRVLEVFVDTLEEVDAEVVVSPTLTNVTGVVFDTPRIRVSAPKTLLDAAPKPLTVIADIGSLPQSRVPGKQESLPVRLIPPFNDPNTRLSPSTVNVSFEVRQTNDERKFDSIPVLVAYPPGMDDKYRVELTEASIPNVTVVGPADMVRAMTPPEAVLKVSLDDVQSGSAERTMTRKPKIELPDGVKLKDAAQQQISVEFKVVEREQ